MTKPPRVPAVLIALMVVASPFNFQGQMLTVTTFAGPRDTYGAIDARGNMARFNYPTGVAVDTGGNLYVADSDNHTIRKVSSAGAVTTLSGLAGVAGSVDGTGSAARFFRPSAVAADPEGNVYVSDSANYTVRKISPSGVVTTLAGLAHTHGFVDGPGSSARFGGDLGDISIDTSGNLYIADFFNRAIRKITPAGFVTTLALVSNIPRGVAAGLGGVVYVTTQDVHSVLKITSTGVVTVLAGALTAGSANGTGSAARFARPQGLTADADGNVYVAEFDNSTVRKINPQGVVTTFAGRAGIFNYADGVGGDSRFASPEGLAADSDGNVYVADTYNQSIRKITRSGVVTTLAGAGLRRETAAPQHYGLAGSADGTADFSRFWYPEGIAIDTSGNLYVADTLNQTIRKISPGGSGLYAGRNGRRGGNR
jgi:sugar lactone lactonase YvrE